MGISHAGLVSRTGPSAFYPERRTDTSSSRANRTVICLLRWSPTLKAHGPVQLTNLVWDKDR